MATEAFSSALTSYCFRLHPGVDLKIELLRYAQAHQLQAATVLSAVGSLTVANLRLANATQTALFRGPLEIVSLIGTLNQDGGHFHISVADGDGKVVGGHLMDGCQIHTTGEIVLLESVDLQFRREIDTTTGFRELTIANRPMKSVK